MRREFQRHKGFKIPALRQLTQQTVTFAILTETRIHPRDINNRKIKWGLKPILHSLDTEPRGGVAIFAHPEAKLLPGSTRTSATPGHFAAGVVEYHGRKLLVAGIYGDSANNDISSNLIFQELKAELSQLKFLFDVRDVILAGDFNLVRTRADTTSVHNRKPRSMACLEEIIDNNHLQDLAVLHGNLSHTWHRAHNNLQSSRLDMIFTSAHINNLEFRVTPTVFDHSFVSAKFGFAKKQTTPAMKDYILGTDEFIISSYEEMEGILRQYTSPDDNPPHLMTYKMTMIMRDNRPFRSWKKGLLILKRVVPLML